MIGKFNLKKYRHISSCLRNQQIDQGSILISFIKLVMSPLRKNIFEMLREKERKQKSICLKGLQNIFLSDTVIFPNYIIYS